MCKIKGRLNPSREHFSPMARIQWLKATRPLHKAFNITNFRRSSSVSYHSLWSKQCWPKTTEELQELLSTTLSRICGTFPTTTIVWSSALPRLIWRFSDNVKAMNEIRGRRNRKAIKLVSIRGSHYIKYPQFSPKQPTLFDLDGEHLTQLGNDNLFNTIKGALQE